MSRVLLAFLAGVGVGGVVNRLASDLPGRGAPSKPHCPYCGKERDWWQWLATVAYIVGKPACPSCGARIGVRRPLVEVGLGLTYGYLWITFGWSAKLLAYGLYSAALTLILITDLERRLILNAVTVPAIILGLVGSFFVRDVTWWSALLGGGIGLTFFLVAAILGRAIFGAGALGGGDVKLAAFVGVITGYPLVIEAIVLTILIGAVISLILLLSGVRGLRDHIPYGPFLVAGGAITLLWGYPIATWFLG